MQKHNLRDLAGVTFGDITVIEKVDPHTGTGETRWRCQCKCGTGLDLLSRNLPSGARRVCKHRTRESAAHARSAVPGRRRGGQVLDIRGQTFGKLTALEHVGHAADRTAQWRCRCECGTERVARSDCLRKGQTTTCGRGACSMTALIDLTGAVFGWLTVLQRAGNGSRGEVQWRCRCECGTERVVVSASLRRGLTRSCGCLVFAPRTGRHAPTVGPHPSLAAEYLKKSRGRGPAVRNVGGE